MTIQYEMIPHAEVRVGDTLLRQGRQWVVDSIHAGENCFLFACHASDAESNAGGVTHEFITYPRDEILIARILPEEQHPRGYLAVRMTR